MREPTFVGDDTIGGGNSGVEAGVFDQDLAHPAQQRVPVLGPGFTLIVAGI